MGRKIVRFLAGVMLLCGAAIFLYPAASKYLANYENQKVIEEFRRQFENPGSQAENQGSQAENQGSQAENQGSQAENQGSQAENPGSQTETGWSEVDEESRENQTDMGTEWSGADIEQLYRELQAYNERLYSEGQSSLQDPFDYESPSFDLTRYGFSQNVIGTLWVPRMEIELPIYLGANYDTMARGAGLLGQTSMPLGGENTNVVLAAHRGWKGIPMFRNIQSLQLGDKIQITTPWETLVYRVCELKIILPGDSEEILIQEGRDLVTLLTCHPYTQNYQRYLVVAERSMEAPTTREADLQEAEETYQDEPRTVEFIQADGTSREMTVDPSGIQPAANEGAEAGAEYSNLHIWLEDYGVWIGFGIIIAVILSMFLSGLRGRRNK